jgi:hypothetical protein
MRKYSGWILIYCICNFYIYLQLYVLWEINILFDSTGSRILTKKKLKRVIVYKFKNCKEISNPVNFKILVSRILLNVIWCRILILIFCQINTTLIKYYYLTICKLSAGEKCTNMCNANFIYIFSYVYSTIYYLKKKYNILLILAFILGKY